MAHSKSGKRAKPPVTPAAISTPRLERHIVAGICAALVLACLAIYGQTLTYEFVQYDDGVYVTDNPHVRAGLHLTGIVWAFVTDRGHSFHPLTWISHMIDCSLYGMHAWGHHFTALLLHACNSMILFLVLRRLTRRLWPSAMVAALFAIHPLHVESVAWVAERKDVLCAFFWLLSLGAYEHYVRRGGAGRYAVVVVAFTMGLMSKAMIVTLPCALLLIDYWPLNRYADVKGGRAILRRAAWFVVEKAPLFLLALAGALATAIMAQTSGNLSYGNVVTFSTRLANVPVAYAIYLRKMCWPFGLAVFYPYPSSRPVWQPVLAALVLLSITAGALAKWRRKPYLVVGWLWFLGTLVPVIQLVQQGTFAYADRYTYLPLIGVFVMLVWGVADLAAAWHMPGRAVGITAGVVLAGLIPIAVVQASYWRDTETLFHHALDVGQESIPAFNNLALRAMDRGRNAEAKGYLAKALILDSADINTLNNQGKLALDEGRYDEARGYLTKVLELGPEHRSALINLGVVALQQGRFDEGKGYLEKAVALNPEDVRALNNLGLLAMKQGRDEDAETYLRKVLDLNPENFSALNDMGVCLMHLRRYEEAERCLRSVTEINPRFVKGVYNLGDALAKLGRQEESKACYKRAEELRRAASAK